MPTQFLDLTNNLLRRLNEVTIAQADFNSVRGVQAMAKDVVNAAIHQINQYELYWPFNAKVGTQVLVVGTQEYDWPSDMRIPTWRSFFIKRDDLLNIHGQTLQFVSRDWWYKTQREDDLYKGVLGVQIPYYVFEKQGFGFAVSPSPDKAYTVTYDYWANVVSLVNYNDMPSIPSAFDEVIIQGAMYHYYMFRDNSQQAQLAEERFKMNLQHMRTTLINKENRVRAPYYVSNTKSVFPYAESIYP